MTKQFFMQKATNRRKELVNGWYMSEKLDGMRVFWDGGLTRGVPKADVPFANHDKDSRYRVQPICTGLWTQLGNIIHAPDWFLDQLPEGFMLGGELWESYGFRQEMMSIVKKLEPVDSEWEGIKIYAYEAPVASQVFKDRDIDIRNCKMRIRYDEVAAFAESRGTLWQELSLNPCSFGREIQRLHEVCNNCDVITVHEQIKLPYSPEGVAERISEMFDLVISRGGEGIIFRNPQEFWETCRSKNIVKMKQVDDAEGTVIGYITGRETDKGSKLLGKMGALVLRLDNGRTMKLSGFTDEERELMSSEATAWATTNPETKCPDWITNPMFPRGTRVTFKYRGLTKDGIPEEPRYWRKRLDD